MGVESVSVSEALSHADTLEISCHSPTRVLLPSLESMETKRHTSYRIAIQPTFTYKIIEVQHLNYWERLKLLGKTARTQIILSPEKPWKFNNYNYLFG